MLTIATFISTFITALLLISENVILEQLGTALFVVFGLILLRSSDSNEQYTSEIETSSDEGI